MRKIIYFISVFFIAFNVFSAPANALNILHCKIRTNHIDTGKQCQYVLSIIFDWVPHSSPLQNMSDLEVCQFKLGESITYADAGIADMTHIEIIPDMVFGGGDSPSPYQEANTWCKDPEGCDASPSYLVRIGNSLINFLPQSPENVRIPNIIANMVGQGTIGANLAIELYSAVWQYLAIIVFVKFYKLIPGKST